jgi:subtilase family serine protease
VLTAPATAAAGEPLQVGDTTKNQGAGPAPASVTSLYLSTNTGWDAADVFLGSRPVSELAVGAVEAASTTVTIPASTAVGSYYILAKADAHGTVPESFENNNVKASAVVKVGVDLLVTSVSAPSVAGAGDTISVAETTKNQGGADAPPSTTAYYLSLNTFYDASDELLASRDVPALDAGTSSASTTWVTIPPGTTAGTYYIVARADAANAAAETSETNNVKASGTVKVGPDLTVQTVTAPGLVAAGQTVSVSSTIKNIGGGSSPASQATFYLSLNTSFDASDEFLGSRDVSALAAGASDVASVPLEIPASTDTGSYYIVAIVDPDNALVEVRENNNVGSSSVLRVGPDLTVTALTGPSSARAGTSVVMSDTTKNQGGDVAPSSTTSFYLSTNATLDAGDTLLDSHMVPALDTGVTSSASMSLALLVTTAPGNYYIIAKADGPGVLAETFETNNTRVKALRIDPP